MKFIKNNNWNENIKNTNITISLLWYQGELWIKQQRKFSIVHKIYFITYFDHFYLKNNIRIKWNHINKNKNTHTKHRKIHIFFFSLLMISLYPQIVSFDTVPPSHESTYRHMHALHTRVYLFIFSNTNNGFLSFWRPQQWAFTVACSRNRICVLGLRNLTLSARKTLSHPATETMTV